MLRQLATLLVVSAIALAAMPRAQVPTPSPQLLFADDFSEKQLDRSKWNIIVTGRTVNNEQQAYIDSSDTITLGDGPETSGAENGALVIRARPRAGFRTPEGRTFDFISGRLESRSKFEFTYGTAAARIKLTAGAGLWPAFWALGTGRWPDTGEMDIMENVGDPTWTNFALHGPGYSGNTPLVSRQHFAQGGDITGWHIYSLDWSADELVFKVDGNPEYRVARSHGRALRPMGVRQSEIPDSQPGARRTVPAVGQQGRGAVRRTAAIDRRSDQERPSGDGGGLGTGHAVTLKMLNVEC